MMILFIPYSSREKEIFQYNNYYSKHPNTVTPKSSAPYVLATCHKLLHKCVGKQLELLVHLCHHFMYMYVFM